MDVFDAEKTITLTLMMAIVDAFSDSNLICKKKKEKN